MFNLTYTTWLYSIDVDARQEHKTTTTFQSLEELEEARNALLFMLLKNRGSRNVSYLQNKFSIYSEGNAYLDIPKKLLHIVEW